VRPRILVTADWYLPGYKAGGPIRSIAGLVEGLGDELDLRIVTRDRDLGDAAPYPGVPAGSWTRTGAASVLYLPPEQLTPRGLDRVLRDERYDVLYLNSLFSARLSVPALVLRRLGRTGGAPTVVAPRGELAPSALAIRAPRKRVFLGLGAPAGLFDGVLWHASSEAEQERIRARFGADAATFVAENIPAATVPPARSRDGRGEGPLRVVFLARISPMKNLSGALEILGRVRRPVAFDIYGPIEDEAYWRDCERLLGELPANVTAAYRGPVPQPDVGDVLSRYDLFLLPTLGENYGVGIVEAMASGCGALISDRTPWRGLEAAGAGWDLPLDDPGRFAAAIDECAARSATELETMAANARELAAGVLEDSSRVERMRALFDRALAMR
jgi:glycosyltransferase involved in cell wall biosynthesis